MALVRRREPCESRGSRTVPRELAEESALEGQNTGLNRHDLAFDPIPKDRIDSGLAVTVSDSRPFYAGLVEPQMPIRASGRNSLPHKRWGTLVPALGISNVH